MSRAEKAEAAALRLTNDWLAERALADRLAEALQRAGDAPGGLWNLSQVGDALAAWEEARQ